MLKSKNISSIDILGVLIEAEGYRLFYASSQKNKLFRLLDMLRACIKYRNKVDYVLIDTYSTLNFYYTFLVSQLCRLFKLKYIPILHGGNLPQRLKSNPKLSQSIFKYAYKIVSPSLYLKESFLDHGYDNILHIPNTIELQHYPFKARMFTTVKLFWVRSFSKIYNPLIAIHLLKALKDEGIVTSLCMVGPDSECILKEAKALANRLKVQVTFTGKLTKTEWIDLSQKYNIFINTTNFDNMPVSVVEAMALGMPIVSTNVGGMPYLISDNIDGLLVPPNNVKVFVNAIKKITNNPSETQRMALNARKKIEQFDWDVVKQLWFKLLN